ncbi:TPA_asm: fusion protein [Bletilla striata amalgavirus 1]|nr:polyprotein [Bletilla amalgavirus 1]DAZ90995.1 TPA_asm: fusion protein [Bletilla striata amalgavirus 1]
MASGGSRRVPISRPGRDPLAGADVEAELLVHLDVLTSHGFPTATWNVEAIHRLPMTVARFIQTVRIITSVTDPAQRGNIVALGVVSEFYTEAMTCTLRTLVAFCEYLRTPGGQDALRSRQYRSRLERQGGGQRSVAAVALLTAAQHQRGDLSIEQKKVRADYEAKIAELQRQMATLRAEEKEKLEGVARQFRPVGEYKDLVGPSFTNRCIAAYYDQCRELGVAARPMTESEIANVEAKYGPAVKDDHLLEFIQDSSRTRRLLKWVNRKIRFFDRHFNVRRAGLFVNSWQQRVEQRMLRYPLSFRDQLLRAIPVGKIPPRLDLQTNWPLISEMPATLLETPRMLGLRMKPPLQPRNEIVHNLASLLNANPRLEVRRALRLSSVPAIPHSRSKFEAGIRKVIGGGEMLNWHADSSMYRGGGNLTDSLKLLADASTIPPGKFLRDCFHVGSAREALLLPSGLRVPTSRDSVCMKNFNETATAGPTLRAFGLLRKAGLKRHLENFAWKSYRRFVVNEGDVGVLPFVTARVGYRTKLLSSGDAFRKMSEGKPLGRCVMMLDAYEQAFSSPLYNIISTITAQHRHDRGSGFRNCSVRASTDWMRLWDEVCEAKAVVELDWKKFDRERPTEDIVFMIEVIISCFTPRDREEELFLQGYRVMLHRSLVERVFITDDGGILAIDGMVPSGSLWTGWLDTALNILYLKASLKHIGISEEWASPKCAGDDNLTLFYRSFSSWRLLKLKDTLNSWFRAGIEDEDFLIHRAPFHVTKVQACFPPGTDLSLGTSKLLDRAEWVPFEDALIIDEPRGKSHRWKYVFDGKPKFLSCYWLENGRPIRPAYINAEKLLFPEGVHSCIEDYEAAVISMVVDNPWNQHNVNHMMHRFLIVQQIKRASLGDVPHDLTLWLAKIRPEGDGPVPFPMIGFWRRTEKWVDIERDEGLKDYIKAFKRFTTGVTSLYARSTSGGLDAWKFLDILRGESDLGEGQFGNEMSDWLDFMKANPLTRYLRPVRSYKELEVGKEAEEEAARKFAVFEDQVGARFRTRQFSDINVFARFISDRLSVM